MKWHPDKCNSNKHQENNPSYKIHGIEQEENWNALSSPTNRRSHRHERSVDDSFFTRSPSFVSRTTNRRSHTPTPRMRTSISRSSKMIDSLKRSTSRKVATSLSPFEIHDASLSKLKSQSNIIYPTTSYDLSRCTSHRSTTPIIFSRSSTRIKPQQVEKKLECSLEELCFGAIKNIKIVRDVLSDVGTIIQEEETLHMNVKPGWRKGTTVKFEGKGDEKQGYLPTDIVFVIDEKSHPLFKRVGDDLELGVEVPLLKALIGCNITLPILGGEKMVLRIDDVIHPGYEKVIQNQGMPKYKNEEQRGDLRLKFNVNFSLKLTDDKRYKICKILEDCD